ncbi:MAG TPA: NAD(P)/FAD-dependent oxidoreductase, partial [Clostridia bacterium]|nr:NAD(P)/FAD-dependent oxidoreductase [Clostridia bacterium]
MRGEYDVIIVGAGPAGIFTALELLDRREDMSVLLMDSGKAISKRTCPARTTGKCVRCDPCAIMSGWAGAGAFSDGKLSLSHEVGGNITQYIPEDEAQKLIDYADSVYVGFGAPDTVHGRNDPRVSEIAYEASRHNIHLVRCPVRHMGTEHAAQVLGNMYDHLMEKRGFT